MKVIVASLNWGLGHASRCIPIIFKLEQLGFTPIIASDGAALHLLQNEFPNLSVIELPSYKIRYGKHLKWSLLTSVFTIWRARKREQKLIADYIACEKEVVGIISDNRFGVYHPTVNSVYITHQINVLSGIFTPITSFFHRKIYQKFDELWIPDDENTRFSGYLSETKKVKIPYHFIGSLSRLHKKKLSKKWDMTILLSGPEPRRSLLEEKFIRKLKDTSLKILLIQGKLNESQKWFSIGELKLVNYLLTDELSSVLCSSERVIARSGYSSVMDLSALEKKSILIPTKGQNEQEYLAIHLNDKFGIHFLNEDEFDQIDLEELEFRSFPKFETRLEDSLFRLFQGKRKL